MGEVDDADRIVRAPSRRTRSRNSPGSEGHSSCHSPGAVQATRKPSSNSSARPNGTARWPAASGPAGGAWTQDLDDRRAVHESQSASVLRADTSQPPSTSGPGAPPRSGPRRPRTVRRRPAGRPSTPPVAVTVGRCLRRCRSSVPSSGGLAADGDAAVRRRPHQQLRQAGRPARPGPAARRPRRTPPAQRHIRRGPRGPRRGRSPTVPTGRAGQHARPQRDRAGRCPTRSRPGRSRNASQSRCSMCTRVSSRPSTPRRVGRVRPHLEVVLTEAGHDHRRPGRAGRHPADGPARADRPRRTAPPRARPRPDPGGRTGRCGPCRGRRPPRPTLGAPPRAGRSRPRRARSSTSSIRPPEAGVLLDQRAPAHRTMDQPRQGAEPDAAGEVAAAAAGAEEEPLRQVRHGGLA